MASETTSTDSTADRNLFQLLERFHAYPFANDPEFKIGLATLLKKRVPSSTASFGEIPSSQEVNAVAQLPELTEEDLSRNDAFVTKAKLFYYSRKHGVNPPLSLSVYQAFLASAQPGSSHKDGDDYVTGSQTSKRVAAGGCEVVEEHKNGSTARSVGTTEDNDATTMPPPLSSSGTAFHGDQSTAQPAAEELSSDSETDSQPQEPPAYPSSFAHIVELITTGQPVPGIQEIPSTVLKGKETKANASRRSKPWEKSPGIPSDKDGADKILDHSDVAPSVCASPIHESNKKMDTSSGGDVTDKQDAIEIAEDEKHKPPTDDTSSPNETEPIFAPY